MEKSKANYYAGIIEYIPHSIANKTIIIKTTGNISAFAFDSGEALTENVSPFDTFLYIIDGKAEIIIGDKSNFLETGKSIIMPANSRNTIKANVRFKMLSAIIKSGYWDEAVETKPIRSLELLRV